MRVSNPFRPSALEMAYYRAKFGACFRLMSDPVARPRMFSKYLRIMLLPLLGKVVYMTESCSLAVSVVKRPDGPKNLSLSLS